MGQQTQFCLPQNNGKSDNDFHNNLGNNMARRPQKGIKKGGKFRPGDGPGVFAHANYNNEMDSGFTDNPGFDLRNDRVMTPRERGKDGGWVDDIYVDHDNQTGDTRSNSIMQSARLDRDASALSGVDHQFHD